MQRAGLRRWRQLLANRGAWRTVAAAIGLLRQRMRSGTAGSPVPSELWRSPGLLPAQVHPFDELHGTDTSGLSWGEDMPTGHRHDVWNTAYYAIAPSVFHQSIQALCGHLALDLSQFTFIDLGAGKGRAVMLASMLPFARVLGVELVPRLHAVACANLAQVRVQGDTRALALLLGDAGDFPWAEQLQSQPLRGPLLLFLYNPFSRPVLRRLLHQLHRELSRNTLLGEVLLLYVNPELEEELARHRWMSRICVETVAIGEEDRLADRFGSTWETFAAYRCLQR